MTARAIIQRALRVLGVASQGETMSAAEAQDGLDSLNALIDSWRARRLFIPGITRNEFDVVGGTARYTIGPAAESPDWEYPSVPTWIDAAGVLLGGSTPDYEQHVQVITQQRFEREPTKDLSSSPIAWVYYERKAPLGEIQVWPNPSGAQTLVLYLLSPLSKFTALTTDIDLAAGYEDALVYQLAVRLAPEMGTTASPDVRALAADALNLVQSSNVQPTELVCDRALRPRRHMMTRGQFLRGD